MNALFSQTISTSALPQRSAGTILVLIAFILIVTDTAGVSLSPNTCSLLLLTALAIIAFAIRKTPGGITSLIGLLFLGTLVFVAARPLLALAIQNEAAYTLTWGATVDAREESVYRLVAFWTIGVSSLYGGYFLSFRNVHRSPQALSDRDRIYCKRSFTAAFLLVAALLPIMVKTRLGAVASGGYEALYLNQTQYSFSATRLIDFLGPLLFALAVIIDEKRYSRLMVAAILGYILTGVLVGQRGGAGSWLLVALWYYSTIRRKQIKLGWLFAGLAATVLVFQWMEMLRGGDSLGGPNIVQFFLNQGLTFLLPMFSWQLPAPPMHSIIGSILPMGALYSLTGVGSAETSSVGTYICSHTNPALFASGYGFGSSVYIEIFYICGQVVALYAAACALLGFLLRKWEERASRSRVALFFLCASLSSLFIIQRGSINVVSSQIIYLSIFMAATYLLSLSLTICRFSGVLSEDVYGAS